MDAISIVGGMRYPYVYAIRTRDLLYIGETQRIPVVRWKDHVGMRGSFRMRVEEHGDPETDYFNSLIFAYYACEWIVQDYGESERRSVCQALEHELHCIYSGDPYLLGEEVRVISDTVKTAPRRFRHWCDVKARAVEIADSLKEVIRNCK